MIQHGNQMTSTEDNTKKDIESYLTLSEQEAIKRIENRTGSTPIWKDDIFKEQIDVLAKKLHSARVKTNEEKCRVAAISAEILNKVLFDYSLSFHDTQIEAIILAFEEQLNIRL